MGITKKILIADDDAAILDAVGTILKMEGFEVMTSHNGGIINDLQLESFPDVLLLDIWMSGTDGRDLCKKLKQSESTRHIPVIITSASTGIEDSVFQAGADAFLAKPFEINHLLQKIYQCMAS